jgi:hypothetical protein
MNYKLPLTEDEVHEIKTMHRLSWESNRQKLVALLFPEGELPEFSDTIDRHAAEAVVIAKRL